MSASSLAKGLSWRACAGAIGGPGLWALNTQLSQILPYFDCATRYNTLGLSAATSAFLALAAGWVSWRSARIPEDEQSAAWRFVAQVAALIAAVFATALGLQGIASLMVNPCQR